MPINGTAVQELMGHAHPQSTAGYAAYNNANAIAAVQGLPAPRHLHSVSHETEKAI